MDLRKIGYFISSLRREQGWTQEQLGERIGVSNKTVSRWENRNYLPPAEILQILSDLYGVSINEILSGERLADMEYKQHAEENIKVALNTDSFSQKEKISYYKKKWAKDHIGSTLLGFGLLVGIHIWGTFHNWIGLSFIVLMLLFAFFVLRYNVMMAYVEGKVFDLPDISAANADARKKKALLLKRIRKAVFIMLSVVVIVSVDLAYNYFSSLVPEINDGLTLRGIFSGLLFGEDGWRRAAFFRGFAVALYAAGFLTAANCILACFDTGI